MMMDGTLETCSSRAQVDARISTFERATKSSFVLVTKDKTFGVEDWRSTHHAQKKTLFWKIKSIPCDGIPFLTLGRKILGCHQGKRKTKSKNSHKNDQNTKKIGCPAQIHIHHVIKFPDYQIEKDGTPYKQKLQMKKLREEFLTNMKIAVETVFYIDLPPLSAHRNHPTDGIAAGMREKPDPLVKEEIMNLTRDGVCKLSEIKQHLSAFVKNVFDEEEVKDTTRRRFYPLDRDIRNVMHRAKSLKQHVNKDDQENLGYLLDTYMKYRHEMPEFLKDQPKEVISHILKRMKPGIPKEDIFLSGEREFTVGSETNRGEKSAHKVTFGNDNAGPSCTCWDYRKHKLPCKHFCAVYEHYPGWNGYSLHTMDNREDSLFVLEAGNDFEVVVKQDEPDTGTEIIDDSMTIQSDSSSSDGEEKIYLHQPSRKRSRRRGLHDKCAGVLKQIIESVYQVKDIEYLEELHNDLNHKLIEVQLRTPFEVGIQVGTPLKRTSNGDGGEVSPKKGKVIVDVKNIPVADLTFCEKQQVSEITLCEKNHPISGITFCEKEHPVTEITFCDKSHTVSEITLCDKSHPVSEITLCEKNHPVSEITLCEKSHPVSGITFCDKKPTLSEITFCEKSNSVSAITFCENDLPLIKKEHCC